MAKIRWTDKERQVLIDEVLRQMSQHPYNSTLENTRIAQRLVLPSDRRRELTGTQQIEWVDTAIKLRKLVDYTPINKRPIFVEELPQPPKPDLMAQLVELLSDAMVQVVAEAIVAARKKLDLPHTTVPEVHRVEQKQRPNLTKIAVYGLFSNQTDEIRKRLAGCFEFRFLKDVSQEKMVSAAQWADHFIIMTKFVSHDYGAIKKYGNIIYVDGAASSLINKLEIMYLEETK